MCWQIEHHARHIESQIFVINDVDVSAHPSGDQSAIVQPIKLGSLMGLAMDDELEWQARPAGSVARPVGEHECRHSTITNCTTMSSGV